MLNDRKKYSVILLRMWTYKFCEYLYNKTYTIYLLVIIYNYLGLLPVYNQSDKDFLIDSITNKIPVSIPVYQYCFS